MKNPYLAELDRIKSTINVAREDNVYTGMGISSGDVFKLIDVANRFYRQANEVEGIIESLMEHETLMTDIADTCEECHDALLKWKGDPKNNQSPVSPFKAHSGKKLVIQNPCEQDSAEG